MIDRFVDIGGIDDHHCFIIQLKINNITQEKSEAVNQRRTDNAMAKRKKDKQANIDQQNIAQKTKDPATPAYGEYICSKIFLLLTRKLLNQGFLVVMLNSSR